MDTTAITLNGYLHSPFCLYCGIPNSHNRWELFFVLSGSLKLICGANHRILLPGDICLIRPHTLHLLLPLNEEAETLIFSSDTIESLFSELPDDARYLWGHYPEMCNFFSAALQLSEYIEWQDFYQKNDLPHHLGQCFLSFFQSAIQAPFVPSPQS